MLLLDPKIVCPEEELAPEKFAQDFWDKIFAWASDKRVRVGEECRNLIYDEYAKYGFPENRLSLGNHPAKREYTNALTQLLSRVLEHSNENREIDFSVKYYGSDVQSFALQMDISGTADAGILGIATDNANWQAPDAKVVQILPAPPESLEICTVPGAILDAENKSKLQEYFDDMRLHIVGGQVDRNIVKKISDELAIDPGVIDWLACEKAKPPRDLKKRWKFLTPNKDITLCITGRVGHATSQSACSAAEGAGVLHLVVETQNEILDALKKLAINGSSIFSVATPKKK